MKKLKIRVKLLIPPALGIIMIGVTVFFAMRGLKSIDNSLSLSSKALEEKQQIMAFSDIINNFYYEHQKYFLVKSEYYNIKEKMTVETGARLESIMKKVTEISQKFEENTGYENEMINLTETSMNQSNTFLQEVSKKLAAENSRKEVSTLERLVIQGATENTNINHGIRYLFLKLKNDIRYKDTLVDYIQKRFVGRRSIDATEDIC